VQQVDGPDKQEPDPQQHEVSVFDVFFGVKGNDKDHEGDDDAEKLGENVKKEIIPLRYAKKKDPDDDKNDGRLIFFESISHW